jgi:general secretion pathway protein G
MRRDEGYTLTEMLVVIGIISLIAAVLTPNLVNQLGRARSKAAGLQVQTVASAIEVFRSDVGRYPTEQEGLAALVSQPAGADEWSGPYLRDTKQLKDPWNHPLVYRLDSTGRHFWVQSLGADGKPGGSGDDRDLSAPAQ